MNARSLKVYAVIEILIRKDEPEFCHEDCEFHYNEGHGDDCTAFLHNGGDRTPLSWPRRCEGCMDAKKYL